MTPEHNCSRYAYRHDHSDPSYPAQDQKRLLMLVEMARQGGDGGADSIITLQR